MGLNGIPPTAALLCETVWLDAIRFQEAERHYHEYQSRMGIKQQAEPHQASLSHEIAQARGKIQNFLKSMGDNKAGESSMNDVAISSSLLNRVENLEKETALLKQQTADANAKMNEILIKFIKLESALLGYNVDSGAIKKIINENGERSKLMEQKREDILELFNKIIENALKSIVGNDKQNPITIEKKKQLPKIIEAIDQILISQSEENIKRLQQWRDLYKKSEAPVTTADDDDDIDLFGSDEETEEEKKLKEERLKAYNSKKAKKPALVAKSSVLFDVKPWDDETDMKELEDVVKGIAMDGLKWGASKLVPLAYGIKKLQIVAIIEDDKVGVDDLTELIEANENLVQSVDIAAFNKL